MSSRARAAVVASVAYSLIAIAYTWPLAARLNGVPHDLGDPLLTTWILWWSGTQSVPLTAAWWNAPAFYPAAGVFGLSEHLLGLAPIAAPIMAVTGQPLIGHNVAFVATFVLSALGAHFLAYTLTRRHDVSAVAAVAFAFAPYRLPQAPHIQVLASFWTPLCLGALHRFNQSGARRWAAAAAAAWVLQALSCGYYLFFLGALVALWVVWFAVGRWPIRRLAVLMAAFAAGGILLVPFLYSYQRIIRDTYGFKRGIGEIAGFGADIASLLSAGEDLLVWGWVRVYERPESNLFPGLTLVLLCAAAVFVRHTARGTTAESRRLRVARWSLTGLLAILLMASALPLVLGASQLTLGGVRLLSISRADKPLTLALVAGLALLALDPRVRAAFHRRSVMAFYLLAALVTWILALGPDPTFMGARAFYRAPYSWMMLLPGFDGLRVPARFWMMTLACLSVVAALAVHRLDGRARRAVAALAVAGLLLDGWPRRFVVHTAPAIRPSPPGVAARLNLPLGGFGDAAALYQQIFDPVPLYNGFSGYTPPHYEAMRAMLDEGDGRILRVLAARGPLGVVVDHAEDAAGALRQLVLASPGATVERTEREWSSYRIPQNADVPDVPEEAGTPIPIKSVQPSASSTGTHAAIDGNLESTWNGGPQRTPAEFTIELQEPSRVSQVVMRLGAVSINFPRRLQVDVSPDGSTWDTVFHDSTALHAYYAGIRHPRTVPLVFSIDRDGIRFIRLRQTGSAKEDWSIAEVEVRR